MSRVLLITLEWLSPFSGNGQYSRCIVRGLVRSGARVLVISGRPSHEPLEAQDEEARRHAADPLHGIVDVPLPSWGRLDSGCAWEAFSAGVGSAQVVSRVNAFCPTVAACVDFHGHPAWEKLAPQLSLPTPMVWLNFRVFSTSTAVHTGAEDAAFYRAAEAAALKAATLSIALCRMDALHLLALSLGEDPAREVKGSGCEGSCSSGAGDSSSAAAAAAAAAAALPPLFILLPPLRSDVAAFAATLPLPPPPALLQGATSAGLKLLTSLVRLSPEKNAAAVPALLAALPPAALEGARALPFMVSVGGSDGYAEGVRAAMGAALPGGHALAPILCPRYLNARELGGVLAHTALNIHPSLAEAYGMTIVEAAAWGVPSLVHVPVPGSGGGAPLAAGEAALRAARAAAAACFTAQGAAGAAAVDVAPLAAGCQGGACCGLGRALLCAAALLPPVGACDLLAPTPWDAASCPGVLPVDFEAGPGALGARVAPLLGPAARRARGEPLPVQGAGGADPAADAAAAAEVYAAAGAAQKRALSWGEEDHGKMLLKTLQGVERAAGRA
jgi:hypothetical protein